MSLYLYLEIFSLIIPLIFSFDKKMQFYRKWKSVLLSILLTALIFIVWDVIFTARNIWGFNPRYLSGIYLLNLPLEEWLFFLIIPYCCLFIHHVIFYYYPDLMIKDRIVHIVTSFAVILLSLLIIFHPDKTYTMINSLFLIMILLLSVFSKTKVLNRFLISFPVIFVPFFAVNAVLTGTLIEQEVVWYNTSEILNIRLLTIPVEDIGYAFSLILLNLLILAKIEVKF